MKSVALLLSLGCLLSACGGETLSPVPTTCREAPPRCVAAPDGCEAPVTVMPTCSRETSTWSCPEGARVYERAAPPSEGAATTCLPFHDAVKQLGGSLVRVPIDGGRCLWVAEQVLTSSGDAVRNVGFEQDLRAPFGACPAGATFLGGAPVAAVTIEGTDDTSLLVQIDGGYRIGAETRVLYRLFKTDPDAVFGVTELGSGLGSWDASGQRIVVPGPSSLAWSTSLDLGDVSRVIDGTPYVWGCHGPERFLTSSCDLARIDASGVAQLFAGPGDWVGDGDVSRALPVFDSGPWISSVVPSSSAGGLVHVYAVGFGSTLETHVAGSVTGTWTSGPTLAACDLPGADAHAFCAGPVVHEELADPTRPGEAVVSYGIGTTASGQAALLATHPEDYWTRLAWVGAK